MDSLFIDDIYDDTIDDMYSESVMRADYYSEGVGETITKGIKSLIEMIKSIIAKFKEFMGKFKAMIPHSSPNPNVAIDKKEVGKVKKFITACGKVIATPFKKLAELVKNHKKATAFIAIVMTFTVGALVVNKKNIKNVNKFNKKASYENSLRDAEKERYFGLKAELKLNDAEMKESNDAIVELTRLQAENNQALEKATKKLESLENEANKRTLSKNKQKLLKKKKSEVSGREAKVAELWDKKNDALNRQGEILSRREQLDDDLKTASYTDVRIAYEIPEVVKLYRTMTNGMKQVNSKIMQGMSKLRLKKNSKKGSANTNTSYKASLYANI